MLPILMAAISHAHTSDYVCAYVCINVVIQKETRAPSVHTLQHAWQTSFFFLILKTKCRLCVCVCVLCVWK
jgi:hypothetical protein